MASFVVNSADRLGPYLRPGFKLVGCAYGGNAPVDIGADRAGFGTAGTDSGVVPATSGGWAMATAGDTKAGRGWIWDDTLWSVHNVTEVTLGAAFYVRSWADADEVQLFRAAGTAGKGVNASVSFSPTAPFVHFLHNPNRWLGGQTQAIPSHLSGTPGYYAYIATANSSGSQQWWCRWPGAPVDLEGNSTALGTLQYVASTYDMYVLGSEYTGAVPSGTFDGELLWAWTDEQHWSESRVRAFLDALWWHTFPVSRSGRTTVQVIPAAAGGGATTDVPLTTFSVSPQAPTTLRSLISNVPTL